MIIKETEPVVVRSTEVHETIRDNDSAAWWIGGIVAIAAIVAIVFLISRQPATNPNDIINATEQGRLAGQLDASQSASSSVADQAQSAADRAQVAADRATDAASKAASVPAPPPTIVNVPAPAAPAPQPVQ